jgi:hypothetical protein
MHLTEILTEITQLIQAYGDLPIYLLESNTNTIYDFQLEKAYNSREYTIHPDKILIVSYDE